jgi:hypothetical protein
MNKHALFLILLLDILGLLFLSGIIGYSIHLFGHPLIPSLLFSFAVVVILGLFNNSFIRNRNERLNKEIEFQTAQLLTTNTLKLNCSYCRVENLKLINLNEDMVFNCVSCKQPNRVILNYGSVRVTTPLNVDANLNLLVTDDEHETPPSKTNTEKL